jgi:hypothetical protein
MIPDTLIKRDVSLASIAPEITESRNDFIYADVSGQAEIIGYKVVFFKKDDSSQLDAISFFDITSESERRLCGYILEKIGSPFVLDTGIDEIERLFGKDHIEEEYIEDCVSYTYRFGRELLLRFDISNDKIVGLEIVFDRQMVDNITDR